MWVIQVYALISHLGCLVLLLHLRIPAVQDNVIMIITILAYKFLLFLFKMKIRMTTTIAIVAAKLVPNMTPSAIPSVP